MAETPKPNVYESLLEKLIDTLAQNQWKVWLEKTDIGRLMAWNPRTIQNTMKVGMEKDIFSYDGKYYKFTPRGSMYAGGRYSKYSASPSYAAIMLPPEGVAPVEADSTRPIGTVYSRRRMSALTARAATLQALADSFAETPEDKLFLQKNCNIVNTEATVDAAQKKEKEKSPQTPLKKENRLNLMNSEIMHCENSQKSSTTLPVTSSGFAMPVGLTRQDIWCAEGIPNAQRLTTLTDTPTTVSESEEYSYRIPPAMDSTSPYTSPTDTDCTIKTTDRSITSTNTTDIDMDRSITRPDNTDIDMNRSISISSARSIPISTPARSQDSDTTEEPQGKYGPSDSELAKLDKSFSYAAAFASSEPPPPQPPGALSYAAAFASPPTTPPGALSYASILAKRDQRHSKNARTIQNLINPSPSSDVKFVDDVTNSIKVSNMSQEYKSAYMHYTNSLFWGFKKSTCEPGKPVYESFLAAAEMADLMKVSYETFVKAQFFWFDKWFARAPRPQNLGNTAAADRVTRYYEEMLKNKVGLPQEMISSKVIPHAPITMKDIYSQNEETLKTLMRNYKMTEVEALKMFAVKGLSHLYFNQVWLDQNPVYLQLVKDGLL